MGSSGGPSHSERIFHFEGKGFDSTLGYPGEGPGGEPGIQEWKPLTKEHWKNWLEVHCVFIAWTARVPAKRTLDPSREGEVRICHLLGWFVVPRIFGGWKTLSLEKGGARWVASKILEATSLPCVTRRDYSVLYYAWL